jgi:hypothetical protein
MNIPNVQLQDLLRGSIFWLNRRRLANHTDQRQLIELMLKIREAISRASGLPLVFSNHAAGSVQYGQVQPVQFTPSEPLTPPAHPASDAPARVSFLSYRVACAQGARDPYLGHSHNTRSCLHYNCSKTLARESKKPSKRREHTKAKLAGSTARRSASTGPAGRMGRRWACSKRTSWRSRAGSGPRSRDGRAARWGTWRAGRRTGWRRTRG